MLTALTIKNYALIRQLEMQPHKGLNIVTGETGAGKSIMLGALGLLLGQRADTKVLLNGGEKCVAEAVFDVANYGLQKAFARHDLDYADVAILRREISPAGKSRAFINDTPVTLDVLRDIGMRLMDIHSQHETLELANRRFQLYVIDMFCGNSKLLEAYAVAWGQYQSASRDYDALVADAKKLKQESDYVQFQVKELQTAAFLAGEQESLEAELSLAENAETIKSRVAQALVLLQETEQAVLPALNAIRTSLGAVADYSKSLESLNARVESARLELADVTTELETVQDGIEFNPERLKLLTERLDLLNRLMKKHQVGNVQELLALQAEFERQAQKQNNIDAEVLAALKHRDSRFAEVKKLSTELTVKRSKAFGPFSKQLVKLLQNLGINEAAVEVEHIAIEPQNAGADQIEILFSANKGIVARPLAEVASGGEFSRLMFAIKYMMAEKTAMPTLILDEIDTGISGEIAIMMGNLMKEMASRHQVVAISHLPQMAAKAEAHYVVYKETGGKQSTSTIRLLGAEERVEEIAKMIGGAKPSTAARENARELMIR